MARTRTLLQMRTRARELADVVGSTFITDASLTIMINHGISRLWTELATMSPQAFRKSTTIATTSPTKSYAVPADFWLAIGVDYPVGGKVVSLRPYNFQERDQYQYSGSEYPWISNLRYEIAGQGISGADIRLVFSADPGTRSYTLWYVEAPKELAADGDAFDGMAGYEDLTIYHAAIEILNKEERDPSALMSERERVLQQIRASFAIGRDAAESRQIVNMRRRAYPWP